MNTPGYGESTVMFGFELSFLSIGRNVERDKSGLCLLAELLSSDVW